MGYKTRLQKSYLLTIPSSCHCRGEALSLETYTRDGLEDFVAAAALVSWEGNGACVVHG